MALEQVRRCDHCGGVKEVHAYAVTLELQAEAYAESSDMPDEAPKKALVDWCPKCKQHYENARDKWTKPRIRKPRKAKAVGAS